MRGRAAIAGVHIEGRESKRTVRLQEPPAAQIADTKHEVAGKGQ